MSKVDAVLQALKACQRKLRQLKAGDKLSDGAEHTFGELADAVESVLEERRRLEDRRQVPRSTPDRRRRGRGAA